MKPCESQSPAAREHVVREARRHIRTKHSRGKAPKRNSYQVITDKILELLEQGTVPWRKPWVAGPATRSYAGREYRGINKFLLPAMASLYGLKGCWITYRQAKKYRVLHLPD